MQYRRLGMSGRQVSVIGLGTAHWSYDGLSKSDLARIVDTAFDKGINLFDTADTYGQGFAENAVGELLKSLPRVVSL